MLNALLLLENNHAATFGALLIPSRLVVHACPFCPHLPHLNWRFRRLTSSCLLWILRFGGLPGGRQVEGGRTESSSIDSGSSSSETTVGRQCISSPLTFVRSRGIIGCLYVFLYAAMVKIDST